MLEDFYPRPPRGGRPKAVVAAAGLLVFLSTPSARRATDYSDAGHADDSISIHALREEGDPPSASAPLPRFYFYPRPPRGGRRSGPSSGREKCNFYPRPPRGGRRYTSRCNGMRELISIHALREEGDHTLYRESVCTCYNFYPRPPRGGRRPSSVSYRAPP